MNLLTKKTITWISIIGMCVTVYVLFPKLLGVVTLTSQSYAQVVGLPSMNAHRNDMTLALSNKNQLKLAAMFKGKGFREIKKNVNEPIGVAVVNTEYSSIRTAADPTDDSNIAWSANPGEKFVVVDTIMYNETEWYRILKPGTFTDDYYYISSKVSDVIIGNQEEIPEEDKEEVEAMLSDYYKDKKMAYEQNDFNLIEPYYRKDTELYNTTSKNLSTFDGVFGKYKVLTIEDGDSDFIYVRVIESFIESENGEMTKVYYMKDLLLQLQEDGSYAIAQSIASAHSTF